jgi:hypothetical protein
VAVLVVTPGAGGAAGTYLDIDSRVGDGSPLGVAVMLVAVTKLVITHLLDQSNVRLTNRAGLARMGLDR